MTALILPAPTSLSPNARLNAANNTQGRIPYGEIDKLATPDRYTVVVHLNRPFAPFVVQAFSGGGGGIVPAHLLNDFLT